MADDHDQDDLRRRAYPPPPVRMNLSCVAGVQLVTSRKTIGGKVIEICDLTVTTCDAQSIEFTLMGRIGGKLELAVDIEQKETA